MKLLKQIVSLSLFLSVSFFISTAHGTLNLENSEEIIQKIVDASYHKDTELTMLQLYELNPVFFDILSQEVLTLIRENQPSYATDPSHTSSWSKPQGVISQYSLLNVSGAFNDFSTDHNLSIKNKKFARSDRYPYLAKFISLFPHATNFRLNVLYAKSCFTQHEEDICIPNRISGHPCLKLRFHLPILTNDDAVMLSQGDLYHFNAGTIYFFHNGCIHDGINLNESEPRVHLLWDMLLTTDTFKRMFQRSATMPFLKKLSDVTLIPIDNIGIDPEYKRTVKNYSYEEAQRIVLCPVQ